METSYGKYRVWLRSKPGPYEQYNGKVDVYADDPEQAEERAYRELQRGAFPERGRGMWTLDKIERLTVIHF